MLQKRGNPNGQAQLAGNSLQLKIQHNRSGPASVTKLSSLRPENNSAFKVGKVDTLEQQLSSVPKTLALSSAAVLPANTPQLSTFQPSDPNSGLKSPQPSHNVFFPEQMDSSGKPFNDQRNQTRCRVGQQTSSNSRNSNLFDKILKNIVIRPSETLQLSAFSPKES